MSDLMTKSVGLEILGLISLTAAMAAFMSTADSTAIGITSCLSQDVIQDIFPDLRSTYVLYISKVLSIITLMLAATITTRDFFQTADAYTECIDLLLCFLWFTIPAFMYGFFSKSITSHGILAGFAVNVIVFICMAPSYFKEETINGEKVSD